MDFITVLKEKVFTRYSVNVIVDQYTKKYTIVNYIDNPVNDQFFNDLEKDLALPISEKNFKFGFTRQEFKGFKNASLQAFIKQKPTMEQFDHAFHSFYKNFGWVDLFNALYIKIDYMGKALPSTFEPYISYLLKQDFTYQDIYSKDFLSILKLNYSINDNNYAEFKENLYSFLHQHVDFLKAKINTGSKDDTDTKIKIFEFSLYQSVEKFIKPEDMHIFKSFWPHILIKKNEKNMMTKIDNTFVFDLNYAYLSDVFSPINNEKIALITCSLISEAINKDLHEYLTSSVIQNTPEFSRFVVQFHAGIDSKNLPDIFDPIIDLLIETQKVKHSYLKAEYKDTWDNGITAIKKKIDYLCLNNQFPDKNISPKKVKI